jgi:hypothetical protein
MSLNKRDNFLVWVYLLGNENESHCGSSFCLPWRMFSQSDLVNSDSYHRGAGGISSAFCSLVRHSRYWILRYGLNIRLALAGQQLFPNMVMTVHCTKKSTEWDDDVGSNTQFDFVLVEELYRLRHSMAIINVKSYPDSWLRRSVSWFLHLSMVSRKALLIYWGKRRMEWLMIRGVQRG